MAESLLYVSRNIIWNVNTLSWDLMTQPLIEAENSNFNIRLAEVEALLNNLIATIDPLAKYKYAQSDDDSDPQYYGFTEKDGFWYILRVSTEEKNSKCCKGISGFETAWTNRTTQTYDYYHNVF